MVSQILTLTRNHLLHGGKSAVMSSIQVAAYSAEGTQRRHLASSSRAGLCFKNVLNIFAR